MKSQSEQPLKCAFCKNQADGLVICGDRATPICARCQRVYEAGQEHPDAGIGDVCEVAAYDEKYISLIHRPTDIDRVYQIDKQQ